MDRKTTRNEGEGNRTAARRYNEQTHEFTQSEEVERKAREATQMNARERHEAQVAEEAGKARAKEEDPAVRRR